MKLIPLTKGKYVMVDDEDYEYLSQWKWCAQADGNNWYARRMGKLPNGKRFTESMHRFILKLGYGDGFDKLVDHKDGNGLNNQKNNLRICNKTQNGTNRKKHKNSYSIYKGVSITNDKNKQGKVYMYYKASIRVNKKLINLGRFPLTSEGEIYAAMAYDSAAKKYFGQYSRLNFE